MSLSTITLFLAATSAQANVMPWQTQKTAVHGLAKHITDMKGRRLQMALMSSECQEACPNVQEMIAAMSGAEEGADMVETYCPHLETLNCIAATKGCQDEGLESMMEAMATIPCFCACPSLAKMEDVDAKDGATAEVCDMIGCLKDADACAPLVPMLTADEEAKKMISDCESTTAAPTADFASTHAVPVIAMGLTVLVALSA